MGLKLKRYLGDGVYAGFDGYQVWIWAARDDFKHSIALDEETLAGLVKYAADLKSALSENVDESLTREQI